MISVCSSCLESPPTSSSLTPAMIERDGRQQYGAFCNPCLDVVSTWPGFTITRETTGSIPDRVRQAHIRGTIEYIGECNRLLQEARATPCGAGGMGFLSPAEREEQEQSYHAGEEPTQFVKRVLAARTHSPVVLTTSPPCVALGAAAGTPRGGGRVGYGSFKAVADQIRDASKCRRCGLPRLTLNAAGHRQRYRAETVSLTSHCSCEGGPAEQLTA